MGSKSTQEVTPTAGATRHARQAPYLLFVLAASVLALSAFVLGRLVALSDEQRKVLDLVDTGLCGVFFFDFVVTLAAAEDRWKYLRTWGWLDLLSAIPAVEPLRVARAGRVVRILRVFRAFRVARILVRALNTYRAQAGLAGAAIVALIALSISSFAILEVEQDPAARIKTGEDAVWWSVATMATVGYGDLYPVTTEGRMIAAVLMVVGVGLFGTLTAFLASLFVKSGESKVERELAGLRQEVAELRYAITKGKPDANPGEDSTS